MPDALHLAWDLAVSWISSAALVISSHFNFFANLPSGIATWHNVVFVLFVCRDQAIDQDEHEDHQVQDQMIDYLVVFRIESLTCNFLLFSFSILFQFV